MLLLISHATLSVPNPRPSSVTRVVLLPPCHLQSAAVVRASRAVTAQPGLMRSLYEAYMAQNNMLSLHLLGLVLTLHGGLNT